MGGSNQDPVSTSITSVLDNKAGDFRKESNPNKDIAQSSHFSILLTALFPVEKGMLN